MICLMNDDVTFQLEGIPLMFAQMNRHFHVDDAQKTFVLSDSTALSVARKFSVLATVILLIVLRNKKIVPLSGNEPIEEQVKRRYPLTHRYRHAYEPILTFKCETCKIDRIIFASHGDFVDKCLFDYHHFCPFAACEVCNDTLFTFTCFVIALAVYSVLDIVKNISLFLQFRAHVERISGVDIGSGILPCYMMQSSASAVGNIMMFIVSIIVMAAAVGQVIMQVPNLFYVFSQADRVSLKATFRLV